MLGWGDDRKDQLIFGWGDNRKHQGQVENQSRQEKNVSFTEKQEKNNSIC